MYFIREKVLAGEFMAGAWCNLASSITVEIAASAGFDWILIDMVHGMEFTFVAVGSDGGMVVKGMQNNIAALKQYKS